MRPLKGSARTLGKLFSWLALFALLAALGASSASAFRGHEFAKDFGWGVLNGKAEPQSCSASCKEGIAGAGNGQFGKEVSGMAVDEATHELYVVDTENHRVEVFSEGGTFIEQFNGSGSFSNEEGKTAPEALLEPKGIAIDNDPSSPSHGDVYVQDAGSKSHQAIDKFSAGGAFINRVAKSPETEGASNLEFRGVAVDQQGSLWVEEEAGLAHRGIDEYGNAVANTWQSFRTIKPPAGEPLGGIAVDSKDDLYVRTNQNEGTVVEFGPEGELLNKELDSEFPAVAGYGLATEAKTDDVYINNIGSVGRFGPSSEGRALEVEPRLGIGELIAANPTNYQSGVAVDASHGNLDVADSAASRIVVFALEEPKRPTIEASSASEVTANSATLQAEINPRGAISEYHFEYGACSSPSTCAESPYEAQVPAAGQPEEVVGALLDFEAHPVGLHLQSLVPARTYHFRAIAHNDVDKAGEVSTGKEVVFTTQPKESPGLPDGRAWELVSPPDKHGTLLERIGGEGVSEAAANGDALAYLAESPTEAEPQGYSNLVSVLAARHRVGSAEPGWHSLDLALPHEKGTGQSVGQGQEYRLFSGDLQRAAVQPFGAFDKLAPGATEQTPYLRSNFIEEDPERFCTSNCLTPLVTSAPNPFGEEGECPPSPVCGPLIEGGSSDARHVVIKSSVGLTSAPGDKGGLYEWSEGGGLELVSVLPGAKGKAAEHANLGSPEQIARQAVSPDGSRVVFSGEVPGTPNVLHLYMREEAGGKAAHTVQLDEGITQSTEAPRYQTASADDSRVFFSENGELYLYETASGKAAALTSGAQVLGNVIGASEDGSYVYFVGNGALAGVGGAVKGNCTGSFSALTKCNLYELHETGGEWGAKLVAVLSGADLPDFGQELPRLTARVAPNGEHLAFMSQQSLTGYDNRDANSGKPDEEVYEFDAETGRLVCASCDPTGARPVGVEYRQLGEGLVAGFKVWSSSTWLAANVPGWTPYKTCCSLYQSRYLANSGRLFFNASDALVPQDVNGTEDVYQYEPLGVGGEHGCTATRPTYNPTTGACVDLISSGKSREESAFLDASETGSDVFFLTSSQLVKQDTDTALDIYDAHECSLSACIPEAPEAKAPCKEESECKAPPTPQPEIFGDPASATFSGAGNIAPAAPAAPVKPPTPAPKLTNAQRLAKALKACRAKYKHAKKRRVACERQAHKRYPAKAKRAKAKKAKARR